jgi:hypothetical protein
VHVPLWLDSQHPKIGWGVSPSFPSQEGTFFGNIIETGSLQPINMTGVTGPKAYFCEGAGITAGIVSGRLGSTQSGSPYVNPYGANVKCNSGQTAAGPTSAGMSAPDGYQQACANGYCWQNGEPITVWRNASYTPSFDTIYRYDLEPQVSTGFRMEVSTPAAGTKVTKASRNASSDAQKFTILKHGSTANWKIALKQNTSLCFMPTGRGKTDGTNLEVQGCDGSTDQAWAISADANSGAFSLKHVASNLCLDANGSPLQIKACAGNSGQKYKMGSSY